MNKALLKTIYIIAISLVLAAVFNFLFFEKAIGISALIFVAIFLAAIFLLGWFQKLRFQRIWWLALLILFFAFMPGVRANEFLTFLNVCATLGLLMLLAHELAGIPVVLMKLFDYLILIILVPLKMLRRALCAVSLIGQIHSKVKHRDMLVRVAKGVIMAVPALIIFGILFSHADLAFARFANSIVHITITERTMQYFALLAFAFVSTLSFFSYIFFPEKAREEAAIKKSEDANHSGRGVEVLVFLGLISVLFLIFIGFQVTYLFGGEANIAGAGFTYAEYARRGFWELLAVAMLSLLALLASGKYVGVESKRGKRFLIPALALISEVAIVIVSASKRLSLYIDAYGMTEQRFYAAAFLILLSILFVLLAVKLLKAKPEHFFVFGTFLSIVAFVATVNIVNPDVFIAKANIEQYERTGKIDVLYMGRLSADAEKWKVDLYKKLNDEDKGKLRELLLKQKERLEKGSNDWPSANLSRIRAIKLLREF